MTFTLINKGHIRKSELINILIGFSLLMCVIIPMSKWFTCASIGLMAVFYIWLLKYHPGIYLKYLYFIFEATAAIVGCICIEASSFYMYELNAVSGFKGSIPLMNFSYWLLLSAILVCDIKDENKLEAANYEQYGIKDYFKNKDSSNNLIIMVIASASLLLAFYVFFKVSGNPSFILGIDRFKYRELFNYGRLFNLSLKLLNYLIIPSIVVIIFSGSKIGWGAVILYCLYAFWTGNKFGIFFSLLCYFTMMYQNRISLETNAIRKERRLILLTGALIIAAISMALFAMSFTTSNNLTTYLGTRLAQQGQLWWKTYSNVSTFHCREFINEINGLLARRTSTKNNIGANYGIYNIMYMASENAVTIDKKLASDSRYTEAGFAAMYYYFGVYGCVILAVVSGWLASKITNFYLFFMKYNQFIRAFICIQLYMALKEMLSSFLFFRFFSTVAIIGYIILFVWKKRIITYGNYQL